MDFDADRINFGARESLKDNNLATLARAGVASLEPRQIVLSKGTKTFDISTALDAALANFDLLPNSATKPTSWTAILSALFPDNTSGREMASDHEAHVLSFIGDGYELSLQMRLTADNSPHLAGVVNARVCGIDALQTVLVNKAKGNNNAKQAATGIAFARMVAKSTSSGALQWEIEFRKDGGVDINGVRLAGSLKRFLTNTSGATAIEYGLAVALIALVISYGEWCVGWRLSNVLFEIANGLGN